MRIVFSCILLSFFVFFLVSCASPTPLPGPLGATNALGVARCHKNENCWPNGQDDGSRCLGAGSIAGICCVPKGTRLPAGKDCRSCCNDNNCRIPGIC